MTAASTPPKTNVPLTAPANPNAEIVLPDVRMHIYRPGEPAVATVHRSIRCSRPKAAGFVRHIEFDISGTDLVGHVRPGQSFGIMAPGNDEKGRPHAVRLYSAANPTRGEGNDGLGNIVSTTVKRTIDENWENHKLFLGVASNFLCDLQEGEQVHLTGPNGKRFLIPANPHDHDYVFFATGTGIAPFRGMVIDLLEAGVKSNIVLVMGVPYASELLYDDFFEGLAAKHSNFTYLTALSREKQPDGRDPMYVQQRIETHTDLFGPLLSSSRALVYICGVAGMEIGIFQQLARTLQSDALEQYLTLEPEAHANIHAWSRKMLNRQIKATKRVFLEVYA